MNTLTRRNTLAVVALALGVAGGSPARAEGNLTPKFSEHIAPIIFNNCASCHRPGEAAPFSLMNYNDVRKRGKLIANVIGDRVMPPWKAEKCEYEFRNERRLTETQIALLQRWYETGMPEGDPARLPPLPKFTDGWQLGEPDLVVKMKEGFNVPADGRDIYRNFVIPLDLTEDKWVQAIDFRPGAKSVVHHSLFFHDTTGAARKLDEADPEPGYSNRMGGGRRGFGALGGWALGGSARALPDGLAFPLPKGADLVLSTHFHPSGKPETETSTIGLYFAKQPPTQAFTGIQLPPLFGVFEGINIPPGEKGYTINDSYVLPVDVKAFGIGAHAHYLAKTMKLTATLPDGKSNTVLSIPDWDFAWQEQYMFKDYVTLPKGTRLDVKISYDNTAENPRNPSNPPKRVRWGEQSTDEMGSMSLLVVAANPSELTQLNANFRLHAAAAGTKLTTALQKKGGDNSGFMDALFHRMDANENGRLERSEATGRLAQSFDRADLNHDGAIDQAEWNIIVEFSGGALSGQRPGPSPEKK